MGLPSRERGADVYGPRMWCDGSSSVPAPSSLPISPNDVFLPRVGGLLDPRVGRGPFPIFNANWPLLDCPCTTSLELVVRIRRFGPEAPVWRRGNRVYEERTRMSNYYH